MDSLIELKALKLKMYFLIFKFFQQTVIKMILSGS